MGKTVIALRLSDSVSYTVISDYPSQAYELEYNGSTQTPTWSNYNEDELTISGTTSATNAGTYTVYFTPNTGYCWSDGTTNAISRTWTINKYTGSFDEVYYEVSLSSTTPSQQITISWPGDGNFSITAPSSTGITYTIDSTSTGKATVTFYIGSSSETATFTAYATDATNYYDISVPITVTAEVISASTTLADNEPSVIQAVAQAGLAENYWSVGDSIPIELIGTVGYLDLYDVVYAFIIGFDHNSGIEGTNTIHFQFGKTSGGVDIAFVDDFYGDTYSTCFHMNTTDTNSGGWSSSYMRNTICPAFLSAMPSEWQSVIAACTKYTDNTGGDSDMASYVTSTSDKIWLLAEYEIFGITTYGNFYEQNYQKQYDYYANGNSAIKYKHNSTSTVCYWWERSPAYYSALFCVVELKGEDLNAAAGYSRGFAPGFMVA